MGIQWELMAYILLITCPTAGISDISGHPQLQLPGLLAKVEGRAPIGLRPVKSPVASLAISAGRGQEETGV